MSFGIPAWHRRPALMTGQTEMVEPATVLGFFADDAPGLRLMPLVELGARVLAGDTILSDRRRPWIRANTPVAGRVTRLEQGPRRSLSCLEITPEGEGARSFDPSTADSREGLAALMQEAGLWPALRTRPFGRVPDPATIPEAIFVIATEGRDGAPDPAPLIAAASEEFRQGLAAIARLSGGRSFLCHAPELSLAAVPGVTARSFRHGLAGDHIHALHPVSHGGTIWQIGWQEVIALGHLLLTGRVRPHRILSLSGPAMVRPGLVAALPGMRIHEIAAGKVKPGEIRLLSGAEADGKTHPFLRPGIRQITALSHRASPARPGPLARLIRQRLPDFIPNARDEALAPAGIHPVPLLRALAANDLERARAQGVLGLLEEDLAALNLRIGRPDMDYRLLLRRCLDQLEAQA